MTSELIAAMRARLDDPDPIVRLHARNRLAALEAEPPPAYPSLARQVANLAGSLASHLASGLATASDEEHARRLAVCLACEPWYDPDAGRCRECGCWVEAKAKMAGEACPQGKWAATESQPIEV